VSGERKYRSLEERSMSAETSQGGGEGRKRRWSVCCCSVVECGVAAGRAGEVEVDGEGRRD
jgi:hypothetical protein